MRIAVMVCIAVSLVAADNPKEIFDRAVSDFHAARIEESVAGFDRVIKLAPNAAPQLWQRGIAQYYVGRYKECRQQFELHRTVNPNDVENAAWHFLCVARAENRTRQSARCCPSDPIHAHRCARSIKCSGVN
jgi:lipoprotein NlpI